MQNYTTLLLCRRNLRFVSPFREISTALFTQECRVFLSIFEILGCRL
jgi:hypothetical protein